MHFGSYAEASSRHRGLSFVADERAEYDARAHATRRDATQALRAENAKLAAEREARVRAEAGDPNVRFELLDGLVPEVLDREIARGRRAGDIGHRVIAFYLADCADRGIYQSFGHTSVISYAMKRHCISRRSARDLVAIGRALRGLRDIDAAFVRDEISWSKVRAIAKVAVPETEGDWLAFAIKQPLEEVERQAARAKKGERPRDASKGLSEVRFAVTLRVSALLHEQYLLARQKLSADAGKDVTDEEFAGAIFETFLRKSGEGRAADSLYRVIVDVRPGEGATIRSDEGPIPISAALAEALACDAGSDETPPISEGLRLRIHARDGYRCVVCKSKIQLHVHHVVFRSHHGLNTPGNLMVLCTACHTLVHEGYLSIKGTAPGSLDIRDRDGNLLTDRPKLPPADQRALEITPAPARAPAGGGGAGGGPAGPPVSQDCAAKQGVLGPRVPRTVDIDWVQRRRHLLAWDREQTALELGEGEPIDSALASEPDWDDREVLCGLRPRTFAEIIGQERVKGSLRCIAAASKRAGRMPDPVLLLGPSGLGKTTLARAFAHELGARLTVIDSATLDNPLTLLGRLMDARDRDVLFFDEIQALPPRLGEAMYQALEDGVIDLPFIEGVQVKTVRLVLPKVAFVAATTNPEKMTTPLRGRFSWVEELVPYEPSEIEAILRQAGSKDGIALSREAAAVIARISGSSARAAIGLYKRVRALLETAGRTEAGAEDARAAVAQAGLDGNGLGPVHHRVMAVLARYGKPIAMRRLATLSDLSIEAYRRLYEPGLIAAGVIVITPRGTVLARPAP